MITLSCPTCGSSLSIQPGIRHVTCTYCGNTHVLPEDQVGDNAQKVTCPIEGHTDSVLKVSVFIKSQVFNPRSTMQTYTTKLGQELAPPARPNDEKPEPHSGVFTYFLPVLFLSAIASYFANLFIPGSVFWTFPFFVIIGLACAQAIENEAVEQGAKQSIDLRKQQKSEYEKKIKHWEIAMQRWEHAYYCQRHDVTFIEGEEKTVPTKDFWTLL